MSLLARVAETGRPTVELTLDGRPIVAMQGDTVLTAMLLNGERLRVNEAGGGARAGFCLMGACQDCWVLTESGERLRACSTFVAPGMRLVSAGAAP